MTKELGGGSFRVSSKDGRPLISTDGRGRAEALALLPQGNEGMFWYNTLLHV
jgi:hypothetical protein